MYDLIIIGAGPAGLTACLYALRSKLEVLLIDKFQPGGYLNYIDKLENYPGFPKGVSGMELTERVVKQLKLYNFQFKQEEIKNIKQNTGFLWEVFTKNESFITKAIIMATGSHPVQLGVEGEKKFFGKGVSYCAMCDAPFFKDRDLVVIGGGNAALEEALYLTHFAKSVVVVHRREKLRADAVLQELAHNNKKIKFILNSVCTEINGKDAVEKITLKNAQGDISEVSCQGVFVFVGMRPQTGFIKGLLETDKGGYIITAKDLATSAQGIYACGDCREVILRQVVTACGEGALAAYSARKYLEKIQN